jgi:hypothetical protein
MIDHVLTALKLLLWLSKRELLAASFFGGLTLGVHAPIIRIWIYRFMGFC